MVSPLAVSEVFAATESGGMTAFQKVAVEQNTLRVKLKVTPNGCNLGDWDTITAERDNSDDPRLLLSLEPIGPDSGFKPIVKEISNFDLTKGFSAVFNLPAGTPPSAVALFLCKDTDKTNKCTGKPKVDLGKLMETYVPTVPKDTNAKYIPDMPKPEKAKDKIYYFGLVALDKSNAYALKDDAMEKHQSSVAAELGKIGVKQSEKVFSEVKVIDALTHSTQPKIEDGALTIVLPHVDVAACVPKS